MSNELDAIRDKVRAAIDCGTQRYIPARYPWTYSADFIRNHWDLVPAHIRGALVVADTRADASQAVARWAQEVGSNGRDLARIFADGYLEEHGIPLGIANTERLASRVAELKAAGAVTAQPMDGRCEP